MPRAPSAAQPGAHENAIRGARARAKAHGEPSLLQAVAQIRPYRILPLVGERVAESADRRLRDVEIGYDRVAIERET